MFGSRASAPQTGIAAPHVREQLARILGSPSFARADRLSAFLSHLVESALQGRQSELKEALLGVEVFGKDGSFDPQVDTIVRVEARRLRLKLKAYYEGDGKGDSVLIHLPKGSYIPVFDPVRQGEEAALSVPPPSRRSRYVTLAARLAAFVLPVALLVVYFAAQPKSAASRHPSIAVLPFADLSDEQRSDYFAEGLVAEITNDLARAAHIRVVAQLSTRRFRERDEDARSIGRQLAVATILDGSVRREKGRVRVTAQLVSADDGYNIWSQTYEREGEGTLKLQTDIAHDISRDLRARLPAP